MAKTAKKSLFAENAGAVELALCGAKDIVRELVLAGCEKLVNRQ